METEAEFKQKYSSLTADQKLDAMYQMYLANNMDSTDVIDKYHGLSSVVSSFSASRIRKNSKLNPMRPAGVLDGFRLI